MSTTTKPRIRVKARTGDRIENLASGLMTSKDKLSHTKFMKRTISRQELDGMYRADWISRKAVDIIPDDMTRAWRAWQATKEQIAAIEKAERKLKVKQKVKQAIVWARLYGWSVIIIGDGSMNLQTPFDPERVKKDSVKFLHVMHRHELTYDELIRDPMSEQFRMPREFTMNEGRFGQMRIHPSRLILFVPHPVPDLDVDQTTFGDPTLQVIYDAVNQSNSVSTNIASMIFEAKLDVVKSEDLSNQLSTKEGTDQLLKRFRLADQMKSHINMLLLGDGEEHFRKQTNFASLEKLVNIYMTIVAGAVDVPVTRFLGQSPGGLNSTGESDLRNYYDMISALQENELEPWIERLDEVIIRHALGDRPEDVQYDWRSLWQMSDKELADIAKTEAETTAIYSKNSLVDPFVLNAGVKNQLIERGNYPGIEQAFDEHEDEGRDDDRLDPPDPPPLPVPPPGGQPAGGDDPGGATGTN